MEGRERVTAGLPSLTPAKRERITRRGASREQSDRLLEGEYRNLASTTAPDAGYDTGDPLQQVGRPLERAELQRRLLRCNRNLHFEISLQDPTKSGIYLLKPDGKQFICGFESGVSPEFSVRHFEKERVPDPQSPGEWRFVRKFVRETRGWRTVLLRLLRMRVVTLPAIEANFAPQQGRQSYNWHELIN